MNPEREQLLGDVLGGDSAFREALLGQTIRQVRRRRALRKARLVAVVLAAALGLFAALHKKPAPPTVAMRLEPPACPVTPTIQLPASAVVVTEAMPSSELIATFAATSMIQDPVHDGQYRVIDDNQLLALAAPRLAALVRVGPGDAELVFLPAAGHDAEKPE